MDNDQLWAMHQELQVFLATQNHQIIERIIDISVPQVLLHEHLNRYRFAGEHVRGKTVIDVACGTGYGSDFLVRSAGATTVHGFDIDPDSVRYARWRYRSPALAFAVGDVTCPLPSEPVDVAVSFETVEHVPSPDLMLSSLSRAIKHDGTLIISTPVRSVGTIRDKPRNPFHMREWSVEEFQSLLRLHFGDVTSFGQLWPLPRRLGRMNVPRRVVAWAGVLNPHYAEQVMMHRTRIEPAGSGGYAVLILVCRHPLPQVDADRVKKLCYGE